jgi:hypothetical protein
MSRYLFPLLGLLLLFTACKNTRQLSSGDIPKNHRKVISQLEKSQLEFETMSAKARAHVKGQGINQSVSLNLKIIHDSIIWGSVAAVLGLEVAYFSITKTDMIALDRFNKKYYQYSYDQIATLTAIPDLNYSMIEKLFCGNLLYDLKQFTELSTEKELLYLHGKEPGYSYQTIINTALSALHGYQFQDDKDKWQARVNYQDKFTIEDKSVPKIIEAQVFLPEENYLKLNYYKISFNQPLEIKAGIPNDYQKAN